ncbi:MAG TPA: YtxH domain-containing protein [Elusimicrobiota bacterium]|nr:YtxH domain-containing protein [Elusimicrobiota bacterium]
MEDKNGASSLFLAFLVGGMVGAALGLLLAPQSGKDTRKKIKKWAEDLEDQGEEWIEKGKEVLEEKADRVKHAYEAGRKILSGEGK